jgi:hypothetical protein
MSGIWHLTVPLLGSDMNLHGSSSANARCGSHLTLDNCWLQKRSTRSNYCMSGSGSVLTTIGSGWALSNFDTHPDPH